MHLSGYDCTFRYCFDFFSIHKWYNNFTLQSYKHLNLNTWNEFQHTYVSTFHIHFNKQQSKHPTQHIVQTQFLALSFCCNSCSLNLIIIYVSRLRMRSASHEKWQEYFAWVARSESLFPWSLDFVLFKMYEKVLAYNVFKNFAST